MLAIIDSDSIVYASAGAAQHRNEETGQMEYEPVSHACNNAKKTFMKILERTKCTDYVAYMTGAKDESSFRKNLFPAYKENRKRSQRPKHYQAVRDYLETNWGCQIVNEIEADDSVCIEQYQAYKGLFTYDYDYGGFDECIDGIDSPDLMSVLVGIDKDLDQVPGLHFNYKKDFFYYITPLEGIRNLYKQILGGDVADNIPRCKFGWREKKAFALIDQAKTPEDVINVVIREFETLGMDPNHEIAWRGNLLYLHRFEGDSFSSENILEDF